MASLLSRDEIDAAVAALPGWSYEGSALVRQVQVPADSQDGLLEAVTRVCDQLDHHPVVESTADSLTFRLWTHAENGVTAKDVDLASRIDRELSGASTDEGSA